jgi:hypothetical protein
LIADITRPPREFIATERHVECGVRDHVSELVEERSEFRRLPELAREHAVDRVECHAHEQEHWQQQVEPASLGPCPLPGGHALLYTVKRFPWTWGNEEVVAQSLVTGARKVLLRDAADARYVPTGNLVFLRRGALFAVPFDAERLEVRGAEVLLIDTVTQALVAGFSKDVTGAGQVAISSNGTLAWVPGLVPSYPDALLVKVDRRGRVSPLPAPVRSYGVLCIPVRCHDIAPDGRHFYAIQTRTPAPPQSVTHINLIQNWFEELRAKVPSR